MIGSQDGPQVLTGPLPRYPELLRQAGIQGRVLLEAIVDTTGQVLRDSILVVSATQSEFVAAARQALLTTLFRPAFVAVALDLHRMRRIPLQISNHFVDLARLTRLDRRAIKIEINRVRCEAVMVRGHLIGIKASLKGNVASDGWILVRRELRGHALVMLDGLLPGDPLPGRALLVALDEVLRLLLLLATAK